VTSIARPGESLTEARTLATRLAALPARAVQAVKHALLPADDLEQGLDRERNLFLDVFDTRDAREGIAAFAGIWWDLGMPGIPAQRA